MFDLNFFKVVFPTFERLYTWVVQFILMHAEEQWIVLLKS